MLDDDPLIPHDEIAWADDGGAPADHAAHFPPALLHVLLPQFMVKHKGVAFAFGGQTYIVPALNLNQAEEFSSQLAAVDAAKSAPFNRAIIAAALRRNYPEITDTQVGELVDMSQYAAVLKAVWGSSSEPLTSGEEPPPPQA